MDEVGVEGLDTQGLCLLVSERHRALVELECELLELAAVWADHYSALPEVDDEGLVVAGSERLKAVGGDGTPRVWEFAAAEFGVLQEMSMYQASNTISNALDLRHRLPLIWARVRAGEVRAFTARKVAEATHYLSHAQAGFVDQAMVGSLTELTWGRCQRRLAAKIIEADPEAAQQRAAGWAADRFVRTGQSVDGLSTVVARAAAGDVVWFDATVDRIAAVLAVRGDTAARDVRRSKALGIMAQPARAVLLLAEAETAPCDFDLTDDADRDALGAGVDPAVDSADDPVEVTEADLPVGQREPTPAEGQSARNVALVRERLQTLKPADLLPPVTLYLHLHADTLAGLPGAVRFEDVGPITRGAGGVRWSV